jgi:hypothetical protein
MSIPEMIVPLRRLVSLFKPRRKEAAKCYKEVAFQTEKPVLLVRIMNRRVLSLFGLAVLAGVAINPLSLKAQENASAPSGSQPPPEAMQPPKSEEQAVSVAKLDGVKGYKGLNFGSSYSDAKESLVLEQDRGQLKIYKRKGEKLQVGSALLETVLYFYFDGKLYGVSFHTHDGQDSLALETILSEAFGAGEESADGGPSTIWIGKTNGVLFDLNTSTGDASAFLFDIKLHDAYLAYEKTALEKAADELVKGE